MTVIHDVMIIGGGPAGLYASFYAGLRDLSVTLFEAQPQLGGKLAFYPEKVVWDIGALPPTKGSKIRQYLIDQAEVFDPVVATDTKIVSLTNKKDIFYAVDAHGKTHKGRSVLIAIGGGIIAPQKLPCFIEEGLEAFVHYQFPDERVIKGRRLVISGGGDAAVDYAIQAHDYGAQVTLCYRGEQLKAHEAQVKKMQAAGIDVILNHTIEEVLAGSTGATMALQLKNGQTKKQSTLSCDHLLVQHGYDRDNDFLNEIALDLKRHEDFYLSCKVPTKTSYSGVFAAGDIHHFEGKVNLLVGAFQDAAQAVNQIKLHLAPESHAQGMVSSHNEKFNQLNQELFDL